MKTDKINHLEAALKGFYQKEKLLFHGWHHIGFVRNKALEFSEIIGADNFFVESAALVHDLNYAVKPNSDPSDGRDLRENFLREAQYTEKEIKRIEQIIEEAHTATRTESISIEGMALSDADTLFKALPITPIIFANRFIAENQVDIRKLAFKIYQEQNSLMEKGIYFYTDIAKERYLKWAKINLELWNNVREALQDKDVEELLSNFK